jgi:hypothetical protein
MGYPPVLVSSLLIIACQIYVVRRYGLISVPSLFTALLTYPALVPFLAEYILLTDTYTARAIVYEGPEHVKRVLFLLVIFISVFAFLLDILRTDDSRRTRENRTFYVIKNVPAFAALAGVNLIAAYLTTPGPTILTADYTTVLSAWYPWAAFAGSLYLGSWTVLYLMSRGESTASWYYRGLIIISAVGLIWLLLHARRNEAMGVMTMLVIDYVVNRQNQSRLISGGLFQGTVLTGLIGVGLFIGKVRSAGTVFEGSIRELFIAEVPTGTYVAPPGSPHNVFATTLATVDIFDRETSFRLGEIFLLYIPQAVPSGVYSLFDLTYPPLLHGTIGQYYQNYNGGNYFVNTYYANFGEAGIFVGAVVLTVLVYFAHDRIVNYDDATLLSGTAVILVVAGFRAMWYTQLNWIDSLQGMLAGYFICFVVTNLVIRTDYIPAFNQTIEDPNRT